MSSSQEQDPRPNISGARGRPRGFPPAPLGNPEATSSHDDLKYAPRNLPSEPDNTRFGDVASHPAFQDSGHPASPEAGSGYIPPGHSAPNAPDPRASQPPAPSQSSGPLANPSRQSSLATQPGYASGYPHGRPPGQPHPYPPSQAAPHGPPQPANNGGSSILKTLLKIIGWTLVLSVIMIGLVLGGGWWTLRNAATDFFNITTQSTMVTKAPVVASLKQVNKQVFIEHNNMVDVDYTEAPEGWLSILPIEQSFVVLLRGRVPAGFDLSDLTEDNIWISADGTKVQLILPPPVIFADNVAVNFEESRILTDGDTCPNFLCTDNLDAIQKEIIPQGKQLLIETSQRSGIMEQAAEQGIRYYESLLRSLGFDEVQVFIRSDVEIQNQSE